VLNRWRAFQRREAQNWRATADHLTQAYRLYTLALAGTPELGAMNRMREMQNLTTSARWRLASAYALIGQITVANELIFNLPTTVTERSDWYMFGSTIQEEAMILETLVLLGRTDEEFRQAQSLSRHLSRETWFSSHSTAFAMIAMAKLAEKTSGTIQYNWTLNGRAQTAVNSRNAVIQTELPTRPQTGNISFTNTENGVLYLNLVTSSTPLVDTSPEIFNGVRVVVSYTDLGGNPIDVSELQQGTDFLAKITVTNQSNRALNDLALTHIIPSGWEIFNERLIAIATAEDSNEGDTVTGGYTFRDIRDDRVLTYFNLGFNLHARRGQSRTFQIRLQASYVGTFVLPAILVEAMYDTEVNGRTRAGRVVVVR
jgi:uncharacterized protein YfaS (alpha-2-macroglobulin family)